VKWVSKREQREIVDDAAVQRKGHLKDFLRKNSKKDILPETSLEAETQES